VPTPSALGELRRRVRARPGATLRFVVTRAADDPVWVLHRAVTASGARLGLPSRLVGPLAAAARRGNLGSFGTLLAATLAVGAGRDAEVERLFAATASRRRPRERRLLGGLAVELERPERTLELVAPATTRDRLVRARALARLGRLGDAVAELDGCPGRGPQRLLARLAGDRAALETGWLPVVGGPVARAPRRSGRVVHLLNNSLPHVQAGYTLRSQRVALAQRAVGLDPVMVTQPGFPWATGRFDADEGSDVDGIGYRHVRDDLAPAVGAAARTTRWARALAGPVAALGPAVLQPTSPHRNAQVALALRDHLDVPVVYEIRGFLEDTWLSRRRPDAAASELYRRTRAVEAACAAAADRVVTLGAAMRDDLVARGVPAERIVLVPNAVDVERFLPRGDGPRVRRDLGLADRTVLGYVTSLQPYEGVGTLLEAARLLVDQGHDVAVLVVGDGPELGRLRQLATDLGLAERVRLPGRVPHDEVVGYYEAIDVFVVPRRADRVCQLVTPLKPLEAMALERPVAVAALPALEELLEPGVSGVTFPAEDPAGLAACVAPLVDDPPRRHELGRAGREHVLAERTWAANGRRYRQLMEDLGAV
jgi:glycosyltransferase involved in cell wall biosynthesis